jgi:opacity protein-like surface antigen
MFMHKLVFLLLVSLLISYESVNGQSSETHKWYVNGNGGIVQEYSDIQEEDNPALKFENETKIAYGIRLARYVSPVYAVHLQYVMGTMRGMRMKRDLQFTNSFQNIQLGATANLSRLMFGENLDRKFVIYGLTGISLVMFQTTAKNISTGHYVDAHGNPSDKEKSFSTGLGFPIGFGLSYNFANNFSVNMETSLNLMDTDEMDGFMSGNKNDAYYYTNLSLTYNFGDRPIKAREIQEPSNIQEKIIATTESVDDEFIDNSINLEYSFPDQIVSGEEFEFQCKINKNALTGKAELMQIFPIGLNLLDTVYDAADRYEFQNYILKVYWDDMSNDSTITINYHAKLDDVFGYLPVTSVLYIDKTGKEYTFDTNIFIEKEGSQEIANAEESNEIVNNPELNEKDAQENENSIANEETTATAEITDTTTSGIMTGEIAATEEQEVTNLEENELTQEVPQTGEIDYGTIAETDEEESVTEANETQSTGNIAQTMNHGNIEYRVQIRASYKKACSLTALSKKYDISEPIQEDYVGRWYRYSIGSFNTLTEAKQYRKQAIHQYGVLDAFVVAFRDGVRLNSISELKELSSSVHSPNTTYNESGRVYRVQILALLHHRIEVEDLGSMYGIDETITEESYNRWRKYTVGSTSSLDEAHDLLEKMKQHGISDAFIVIYDNGTRLNVFGI